jgi:acetylornithine deacetylase/succinyl-diaminopimelate desuccinylase-like protein
VCQLAVWEAWIAATGSLPVTVSCVFDGEEDIGSPNLRRLLGRDPRGLAADAVLVSDTRMAGPGRPALVRSLRGKLAAELGVKGSPRDLHQGAYGGAVRNPATELGRLVASLHYPDCRVAVEGFYDRVRAQPATETAWIPYDAVLARAGVREGFGVPGWSAYQRSTVRPALDVTALAADHTGPGCNEVILRKRLRTCACAWFPISSRPRPRCCCAGTLHGAHRPVCS